MSYRVKLSVFEGPFDLLVYLIENAEMSIYDIQIAEITEQYIAHIEAIRKADVDMVAEFMVLAATLIEIKSKMLLPRHQENDDEIFAPDDPRKDLVQKLLEYKKFKSIAAMLEVREEIYQNVYYKPQEDLIEYTLEDGVEIFDISVPHFIRTFRLFLEKRRRLDDIQKKYGNPVQVERISIKEKISFIRGFMKGRSKASFAALVEHCTGRYEVAVTFIAMLDMMRNRQIKVVQRMNFGEIVIRTDAEKMLD